MSGILDFVLSPWGLLAYAAFWALKIMFGAWVIRKVLMTLPEGPRDRIETAFGAVKLRLLRQ